MLATRTEAAHAPEASFVTCRPRLVYLAGSGHTGSTLLALLMNAHPAIASVGEIAVKPKIRHKGGALRQKCSCGALIAECGFWQSVFQKVRDEGIDFGPSNWANDYRFTHPLVHRLLTRDSSYALVRGVRRFIERYGPMYRWRIRQIDRANEAFVRAVLETAGAEVFLDTSKGPMRLARLVNSARFDLRIVTLVRDVRGYAASAQRRGKGLMDAAETWKNDQLAIRAVAKNFPPDRLLRIRYEDLCADLTGCLARLHVFCGVAPMDPPGQLSSRDYHVLGNTMRMGGPIQVRVDERWRQELSEREQAKVLKVAGALHQEFGYLR